MREICARLIFAGIALLSCMEFAAASDDYRLLRLAGTWVKWGNPTIGTRAEVTYALAANRMSFPGARNCESIVPVKAMLRQSKISAAVFRRELRAAFDAWSRAANIRFVPVADPATADIVIGAQQLPRGKAYTNVSYDPGDAGETRRIRKSLICLNPSIAWKVGFDGNIEILDLRYTLLHEIGHAIGLDHPGPSGQVMSFKYDEGFRDLRAGDMFGASRLYGNRGNFAAATARPAGAAPAAVRGSGPRAPATPPQISLGIAETPETGR